MAAMTSEMQLLEEKPWINHITGEAHSASERFEEVLAKMLEDQLLFEKKRSMMSQKNKEKKKKKKKMMMMMKKKKKNAAEASVTDAGNPEEADLKQRDLLDSQEKLAKKKAKDEEAGKAEASVTEAGKPEESVTDAGKTEASDTAEPLMQWYDPIACVFYPQITQKQISEILMKHRDEQDSLEMNRSMMSKKKKKNKNKKKAAEASVTEAGKSEESVTDAGKAEASVAEVEESVTEEAVEDAAMTSDASNALQPEMIVFEDAEYFGAEFESFWNRLFSNFSAYNETTTIPAMCYTHRSDAVANVRPMDTLQVVSVKVASIEEGLHWPLQVFGMVSVRDVLDRKRNIIFHRERDNCQTITEKDPYLTLTGPSRAVVVCIDPSYIEIVLKVKGSTESEDKELSRLALTYRLSSLINGLYPSELSMLELMFTQEYSSVEATVHVKVIGGSWPDGFKGVFSAATARSESLKVKLLDVGDDGLLVDAADGTIRLSRRVVSVELDGMLKVFASAWSGAGDEEHCEVSFVPEKAGVSSGAELKIGSCCMVATVAWSLFCRH